MPTYDPRVDAFIAKAAPFAQPILTHLRELVHTACLDVEETLKWGMPSFEYKGLMCGIGSFKKHCTFGFWKSLLMADPQGAMKNQEPTAMGSFGKMTSIDDLPSDKILTSLIKEAMRLNEEGVKLPAGTRRKAAPREPIAEPEFVSAALKKNEAAQKTWEAFPPSHRREYLEWITEAKTETTREKRLAQMLEWVGEGKQRNWKHQK